MFDKIVNGLAVVMAVAITIIFFSHMFAQEACCGNPRRFRGGGVMAHVDDKIQHP